MISIGFKDVVFDQSKDFKSQSQESLRPRLKWNSQNTAESSSDLSESKPKNHVSKNIYYFTFALYNIVFMYYVFSKSLFLFTQ